MEGVNNKIHRKMGIKSKLICQGLTRPAVPKMRRQDVWHGTNTNSEKDLSQKATREAKDNKLSFAHF